MELAEIKNAGNIYPVASLDIYEDFTMAKPLGYYANFSPGDESALDELRDMFGESLEKLTSKEKFFLIAAIAAQQSHDLKGMISPAVHAVIAGICVEKEKTDLTGLLAALIDYAKPTVHNT